MKISNIAEGHWTVAPGKYPGSMYKGNKKPKRHSLLLHPDDRERFTSSMGLTEDIDDIKYGKIKDDEKYENAPTPFFGNQWKSIELSDSPLNSSKTTKEELELLAYRSSHLSRKEKEQIKQQDIDNLEQLFIELLRQNGEIVSSKLQTEIKQIAEELTTIGIFFKKKYNRPRPYQLMKEFNIENDIKTGATTQSPSYPSTHAIIGCFLAKYLSDKFTTQKKRLYRLGYDLGNNRVKAGFHYPSDFVAGIALASQLWDNHA